MIGQGPRQIRSRTSLTVTTGGERDALIVRPTIAIVDAEWTTSAVHTFWIARLSTPLRPKFAFSLLATPAAVRSTGVCRPRKSPLPSFLPSSFFGLARFSFSPHSAALPAWHSSASSHTRPFFFEGLVLSVSFHACHALVVASTVEGLHLLDPVHGRLLSLPVQFLLDPIFLGVPLFSARCGRIHALTLANGQHTRPPTLVTFGTDSRFSVEPWHVGPVAAA